MNNPETLATLVAQDTAQINVGGGLFLFLLFCFQRILAQLSSQSLDRVYLTVIT
jgi:hypothetical protein